LALNGTGGLGANALTVNNTAGTITLGGVISGTGSLTQNGISGTLLLSGANTYSGGTTLTSGSLTIANASALGTNNLTLAGVALNSYCAYTVTNNDTLTVALHDALPICLALNGTGGLGANALTVNNTAGTITLGGVVSGTGSLTQNGVGGT